MKKLVMTMMALSVPVTPLMAQDMSAGAGEAVVEQVEQAAAAVDQAANPQGDVVGEEMPATEEVVGEALVVDGQEQDTVQAGDGSYKITNAKLNDIFLLLAKKADKQYFYNDQIAERTVTGHLNGDLNPLKQMEELAYQYGLRMYERGNTVYAMTEAQLDQLPATEWSYQLRYLRPSDMSQIKMLISPLLTPGRGIVNFEPKTNTLVIIDSVNRMERVKALLAKIDKPKGQIVVEVKVLRVNRNEGSYRGTDWSSTLGRSGLSINTVASLNNVFGIPSAAVGDAVGISGGAILSETSTANVILSPVELQAVVRALDENGIATQQSNPVVITEDNEAALVALIDRYPIITTTTNQGTSTSSVSEEVRYTIDESDSTDPENTREIGVTLSLTPTLLPDGTVRMNMRPRVAQITEFISSAVTENSYPRVSEATIDTIARIPDGHSLVVGGFFTEESRKDKNGIPILGKIPVLNFFFGSESDTQEKASLCFIITPTSYDPADRSANDHHSNKAHNFLHGNQAVPAAGK